MTVEAYLERKSRRSDATKLTYSKAELAFAKCFGVESADIVVSRIKARKLDAYEALDKFVGYLLGNGSAPKTVLTYTSAIKGLLRFEDITVDSQKLRDKVELPPKVEVSIDRIPTREEMRSIILNSDRRTRALIALLATSGLRAGEAVSLRTGNLELLTNKVSLMSIRTKTKRSRYTFFSDETAQFLREYLGERLNQRNGWVFPDKAQPDQHTSADAAYMDVYRVLKKLGLKEKLDPDSKRNELHPHSFRKYFFSKLIGAGVDRGIAEFFMGHRFGLDSAYLHMPEESFKAQYMKAVDDFTFLHDRKLDRESKERVDELQNLLKRKEAELRVTNERLEKLESRSTATPEDIREEVRRILKEQGPELLKQLGKA